MERQVASAKFREKRAMLCRSSGGRACRLSHLREKPHSIRDFARVQGVDKNSGVARDFMQSLPSAL